jgi:hypothetical protein
MDNETKDQLTEHITSILAMIDKVTTGGDNYTDTYADDEHDDDDDEHDELDPLSVDITYTLQVLFCTGGPHIEARIPIVHEGYGWAATGYDAEIVGYWGGVEVRRPLSDDAADMLVERYAWAE